MSFIFASYSISNLEFYSLCTIEKIKKNVCALQLHFETTSKFGLLFSRNVFPLKEWCTNDGSSFSILFIAIVFSAHNVIELTKTGWIVELKWDARMLFFNAARSMWNVPYLSSHKKVSWIARDFRINCIFPFNKLRNTWTGSYRDAYGLLPIVVNRFPRIFWAFKKVCIWQMKK